jgi:hypothetical protein
VARPAWRPIRAVDAGRLREARLEAHHAMQWLARAARAFVPPQPDDRHTNLGWDDALDGFTTQPLTGALRLELRITDLTLVLAAEGKQQSFALDGRTDVDARQWLGGQLTAHRLDAGALDTVALYQTPDHPVAHGAAYGVSGLADALAELAAWFANASASLDRLRDELSARGLAPSPVCAWPHHFDLASLTSLEAGDAEHARSVNAGFSPGDEHYDEPYFYVSPYPYPDPAKLPPLAPSGHWHLSGFTAAIAPASRILADPDRQTATEAFLAAAVDAAIAALR